MDQSSGNIGIDNSVTNNPKLDLLKNLLFFFGEIVLLIIFLIIGFVTLNYFNILRLEAAFPALSFLPHRYIQTKQSVPNANVSQTPNQNRVNTKPSGAPAVKPLDASLKPYVSKISDFLVLQVQKKYIFTSTSSDSLQASETNNNIYSLIWSLTPDTQQAITAKAVSTFYPDNSFDTRFRIHSTQKLQNFDQNSAEQIASKYFLIHESLRWNCNKNQDNNTVCTSSTMDSNGIREGYTIYTASQANNNVFVLYCSISKNDPLYNSDTFCLTL